MLRQLLGILSAQNATAFTEDTVPSFLVDLFTILQNQSNPLAPNGTISNEQLTNIILPFIEQFKNVTATGRPFSTDVVGSLNGTELAPFLTEFLVPLLQSMESLQAGLNSTASTNLKPITEETGETIEEETSMRNLRASTSSPRSANVTVRATSSGRITQTTPRRNGTIAPSNVTQADFFEAWPLWNDLIAPIRNISDQFQSVNQSDKGGNSTEVPADGINFILQLLTPVQNPNLVGRNDTVTLIPELSDDSAGFSRLLRQPQDPGSLVVVELSVKPQENILNPKFVETITEGLKTAYLDGRAKQQGIGRTKRIAVRHVANDTANVNINVIMK